MKLGGFVAYITQALHVMKTKDFHFAIFPGIIVLTALFTVADIPVEAFGTLLHDFGVVLPGPVIDVVEDNLQHVANTPQSAGELGENL